MISRLATSSFSQRSKLCSSSCRGITTILKCICYSFSQDKTKECQQPAGQLHPKISQPWTAHCTSSQLYIVLLAVTNDNVCAKSLQVGQLLCHFVILCNLYWHNIIGCYFISFFQPELFNNWTAYGSISLSRSEVFDLPVNIYLIRITISANLFAICMLKKVIGTFACYQNGILSGSGSLNCDRARAGMYGPLQKAGPHILIAWAHLSWLTKLAAFRSTERNVLNMTEHS